MKKLSIVLLVLGISIAFGQNQKPRTLKGVLLEQLRTTHNQKDWFVPVDVAVEGLTPQQASWKDAAGNHSVGQLVNHLAFWDQRALEKFKGEKPAAFDGNNDETFNDFDSKTWTATVQRLDKVMKDWEEAVQNADDQKLQEWASQIAHVGAHNAYHIGQIVYVRKEQGSWNPANGVK